MKTNKLLNIIGGALVAASSIFYVTGCSSPKPQTKMTPEEWNRYIAEVWNPAADKQQAKRDADIKAWNQAADRQNAKMQAQNNYQTLPPQNNLEKDAEKAITDGVGDFIGNVLLYKYLQ